MKALLIAAAAALLALPAAAQSSSGPQKGEYELGAGGVYVVPADGDGRWGPSGLARYYFGERVAAELSLDYRNESYSGDVTAHTGAAQLSLVGLLAQGQSLFRIEPLGGVGVYVSRTDENDLHRDIGRFGGHLGAALEVWPGKDKVWGLLASYRHLFLPDLDSGHGKLERSGEQLNFSLTRRFGKS